MKKKNSIKFKNDKKNGKVGSIKYSKKVKISGKSLNLMHIKNEKKNIISNCVINKKMNYLFASNYTDRKW